MVQVINRMEDAGGAECIKFRVYPSPVNPERILASWQYEKLEPVGPRGAVAIDNTSSASRLRYSFSASSIAPVGTACRSCGVDDLEGLFSSANGKTHA